MRKRLLAAAASLAFIGAIAAAPVQAQDPGAKKPLTPQQQKMKDCAGKWKDEKAQKHVSGRTAYRAFMKDCLRG